MSAKRVENILSSVFTVVLALLIAVSLTVYGLSGHIRSWEGFFRRYLSVKRIVFLCGITLLAVWLLMELQRRLTFPERVRKLKWGCLCAAAVIALAVFPWNIPLTACWFEKYDLVAHAGGRSPNGISYTNSLEAFEYNYQLGHRVFEGDLYMTADGVLVLEHHWEHWRNKTGREYSDEEITRDVFMATKFYETETPMDIERLIELMVQHKDMYFMTDFKECDDENEVKEGFRQIVQAAEDAGHKDVLNRFIIQNHNDRFKHWVDEIYHFKNWLYTMYSIQTPEESIPENLVAYCEKENIPVITMWDTTFDATWLELTQSRSIRIYVHTVNDIAYANYLLTAGVAGIYTDDIMPGQLVSTIW